MTAERVLDWRSRNVRAAMRLWGQGERPPAWLRAGARATAPINRRLLARRVAARGPLPPSPPLVISLGNLRLGGTGKTPVILDLIRSLSARGLRGAVVTRGHGSPLRGPLLVAPDNPQAGDEARLLAAASPTWPVVQAVDRTAGLALALSSAPAVILLEDAHQTARVPRHADVLIVDRWRVEGDEVVPQTGLQLPWGPYREGPEGARRAAIWLVEGPVGGAACLPALGRGGARVLNFRRELRLPPAPAPGIVWGILSGIARPELFEAGCARLPGLAPVLAIRLDDHAPYSARVVARVLDAGKTAGVTGWLTTAKDAVKLASFWPVQPPLTCVELAIVWGQSETLPDLVEERLALREAATVSCSRSRRRTSP